MTPHSLGYLEISSTRVDRWREFATTVLGAQAMAEPGAPVQHFAFDDLHHRLAVSAAGAEAVTAIGWELTDEAELDQAAAELAKLGWDVREGSAAARAARHVAGLYSVVDPAGFTHDLFWGQEYRRRAFVPSRPMAGFVTGSRGFGHAVMTVPDVEATTAFYTEALGFQVTEVVPVPRMNSRAVFLRCNPRHHSVALIAGESAGLHHLMVQLRELDDVGIGYDLVEAGGHPLFLTLGRHHGDGMLSFYVVSPSGFAIEYGWGAFDIPDDWQVRTPRPGEIWGHKPVEQLVTIPPAPPATAADGAGLLEGQR